MPEKKKLLNTDSLQAISVTLNNQKKELKQLIDAKQNLIEIKYKDLVDLRDQGKLIPGCSYRITDFITTAQDLENGDVTSAFRQFDVVVMALSKNTLSENGKAMVHKGLEISKIYCPDIDNSGGWFERSPRYDGKYNNKLYYAFKNLNDSYAYLTSLNDCIHSTDSARVDCISFGDGNDNWGINLRNDDEAVEYEQLAVTGILFNDYFGDTSEHSSPVKSFYEYEWAWGTMLRCPIFDGMFENQFYYAYRSISGNLMYIKDPFKLSEANFESQQNNLFVFYDSSDNETDINHANYKQDYYNDIGSIKYIITYPNISAWELKYSLDNDYHKYNWAIPDKQWIVNIDNGWDEYLYRWPEHDRLGNEYPYAWASKSEINDGETNDICYTKTSYIKTGDLIIFNEGSTSFITVQQSTGVIYYLKDDLNNEVAYDFKNILLNDKFTFNLGYNLNYDSQNVVINADASTEGFGSNWSTTAPVKQELLNLRSGICLNNYIGPYYMDITDEDIFSIAGYKTQVLNRIKTDNSIGLTSESMDCMSSNNSNFENCYNIIITNFTNNSLFSYVSNCNFYRVENSELSYLDDLTTKNIKNSTINKFKSSIMLGAIEYTNIFNSSIGLFGSSQNPGNKYIDFVNTDISEFSLYLQIRAESSSENTQIVNSRINNSKFNMVFNNWQLISKSNICNWYLERPNESNTYCEYIFNSNIINCHELKFESSSSLTSKYSFKNCNLCNLNYVRFDFNSIEANVKASNINLGTYSYKIITPTSQYVEIKESSTVVQEV